jgi:hypothetical protein
MECLMAESISKPSRTKRVISLRDLFWITLVVAAGFGAYRWGFQAGRAYREPQQLLSQVHYLPFALNTQGVDRLRKLILTTIEPDSWTDGQGEGSIEYFATGKSLVVNNRQGVHHQVAKLINELNRLEHPKTMSQPGAPRSVQEYLESMQ